MPRRRNDNVIEFTPEPGFMIEKLAPQIIQMMRDMGMDAHINLPNGVTIEIEQECTAKEIIAGYKELIKAQIRRRSVSNKNEKEKEPVK